MALQQIANTDISSTGTFALGSVSSSALTSGRVTFATAGGLLTDSSTLTYDGTTLTSTKFAGALNGTVGATTPSTVVATSITNSGLTSGRVTFATTSGLLTDSSTLTYDAVTLTTPRLALGGTTLPSAGTATLFLRSSDNSTYLQTGSGNNIYFLDGSQNTMLSLTPTSLAFLISNAAKLTLNSTTLHTANGISVGIGTDSPYGLLNIKGSNGQLVLANGNTSGGMKLTASNSTYTGNGYLAFEGYANEYGRFDSSGNLGIGTTSPTTFGGFKTLELANSSGNAISLVTGTAVIAQTISSSTNSLVYMGARSNHSLVITTNDTERMRITSTGLVGIGTTSPNAKLQVTTSSFPVLKVADELGGGAIALGDAAISSNYVGIWRGAANSISGGGFLNVQGNNIAFMSTDNVFGSATRTMTLDNAGNLALGISSGYRTATGYVALAINATSGSLIDLYASGTRHGGVGATGGGMYVSSVTATPLIFSTTDTERMRIDSSGNVGIGTTATSTYRLNVKGGGTVGDSSVYAQFTTLDTGTTATDGLLVGMGVGSSPIAYINQMEQAPLVFQVNGSERARIDANGFAYIRATSQIASPSHQLSISHDGNNYYGVALWSSTSAATQQISFFNNVGTQQGYISTNGTGTTSYVTSSDYRLKENVVPMTGALAKVEQLKPVTFKWKEDGSDGQGFIAHELAEVVPQCVDGEKDGIHKDGKPKYQGVDTSFLVATLTAAIQEQQALIESMATKLKDAGVAGF
jgi:hypothetical protein